MKFLNKTLLALSFLTVILFVSCSSDDDNNNTTTTVSDPFVLSLAIQGSEGGFTYYTVPFEDVMSGTLTATGTGIEQPGYYDFTQIDETIYSIGGLDDTNVVGINLNTNNELTTIGDVSFANALSDIVKADDETLVSVSLSSSSDMVTFRTFDVNTLSVTSTVQSATSNLTDTSDVPAYSGMGIVGDYLFLSYYISNPTTWATNYTDQAQVAVYSYPELEFQEVITDDRVGPIGGFNIKSGLIKDESGNIYAVSHTNPANGYSQFTKSAGILKINAGETSFDQDYFFDIEEATGGYNTAHLKYLGNGLAFAEINTAARANQATWSDSPLQSAIINLETQEVNFITGVPEHNGDGRRLAALYSNGYIYLCIPEDGAINVYRMDTSTYTATKGATVEANFVAGFFKL